MQVTRDGIEFPASFHGFPLAQPIARDTSFVPRVNTHALVVKHYPRCELFARGVIRNFGCERIEALQLPDCTVSRPAVHSICAECRLWWVRSPHFSAFGTSQTPSWRAPHRRAADK